MTYEESFHPRMLDYGEIRKRDRLGIGAYGTVYKINGEELSQKLGIGQCKGNCWVLKSSTVKRFGEEFDKFMLREIAVIIRLHHINIINLFAAGFDNNHDMFYVMPAAKTDLRYLINEGNLTDYQKRSFAYQLMCGVDYYLGRDIIHADLKPQNLLIYQEGNRQILKIADFGLATSFNCERKLNDYNVVTLWYRAPELLFEIPYTGAIDKWSVGCILYELYSGRILFQGSTEKDQIYKIMRKLGDPRDDPSVRSIYERGKESENIMRDTGNKIDYLADLSGEILFIIDDLLQYDPDKRGDLHQILSSEYFSQIRKDYPESSNYTSQNSCLNNLQMRDTAIGSRNTNLDQQMIILMDWLLEVTGVYKQSLKVYFVTAYLVYKYLLDEDVPLNKLQLLGMAAFYLASAYYVNNSVRVSDMVYISDNTYTRQETIDMIEKLLFKIGFDLIITSPDDYVVLLEDMNSMATKRLLNILQLTTIPRIYPNYTMYNIYKMVKADKFEFPEITEKSPVFYALLD